MQGMETAVVVAPPGEEIFTDKYGRVKVKFHWDRTGREEGGGSTSCWLRVASPWAGAGTGAGSGPFILPRVGWEVVVAFLEGDPDQPIIVGSVYNADHLPPPPER
jgi:type VI secretion system secreted protein VgrG